MKNKNNILTFLLVILFLFHAFVPHLHHDQFVGNQDAYFHANAKNCLDVIKNGFHNDIKIKFDSKKYPEKSQDKLLFPVIHLLKEKNYFSKPLLTFVEPKSVIQNFYYTSQSLRAPPLTKVL